MQVFLRAQNYEIWKVVEVGPYENQGEEETWTREQIRRATLNYSAMNMIQCAVHPKEYSRISMCKSAKEMWDKLELLYEGTSQVKETKANIWVYCFHWLWVLDAACCIFDLSCGICNLQLWYVNSC